MSAVFRARYVGLCSDCDEVIRLGDLCRYNDADRVVHDTCPDPAPSVRPGEVACLTCFLIHPEGACDR